MFLRRWRSGDHAALDELIASSLPWIRSYVQRRMPPELRGKNDTLDFVQDALVQVLEHGPQFEIADEGHFRALLARIVANDIRDRHRWAHRQRRDIARERRYGSDSVLHLDSPVKAVTRPSQAFERDERKEWVRLGMEFLEPEDRELLRLRVWEKRSFVEIGEKLRISDDAARMRYRRALGRIADRVSKLRKGQVAQILDVET